MRTLRDLLSTWENWSARETLRQALANSKTAAHRALLGQQLDRAPQVDALDALRDTTELVNLLSAWRWQAVHAARVDDGATWEQIGQATGVTAEQARADYAVALERIERAGVGDVDRYRRGL